MPITRFATILHESEPDDAGTIHFVVAVRRPGERAGVDCYAERSDDPEDGHYGYVLVSYPAAIGASDAALGDAEQAVWTELERRYRAAEDRASEERGVRW